MITSLTTFHGTDGSPSLDRLARAPRKVLRAFAMALADFCFVISAHNANHLYFLLLALP